MKVFCILGDERIFRSKSPPMFSKVLKQVGIDGTYVPFKVEPEQIGWALQSLRVLNIAGANVTVPYKEAVIPYLDILSEGAQIIGAINTITLDGESLKGFNTNSGGFMDALNASGIDVAGKSALVFGTGGAARAIVFMLKWLNADPILVTGRSDDKIKQLIDRVGGEAAGFDSLPNLSDSSYILINTTSVSAVEEAPELAAMVRDLHLPGCEVVFDLNYGRSQNFWQDKALSKGIKFVDGLLSLAYQARRSFELWTGVKVDPGKFLQALEIK